MASIVAWWKRDTARHTFFYLNFVIGLTGTIFSTYVVYQLQTTGYLIGTDVDGGPCTVACIVPFGKQQLDLQTVLLYMNALTLALGGFIALIIIAFADFWKNKSLLVTISTVIYGALSIPAYWLTGPTLSNFNSLFALYVVFGTITTMFMAIASIYIPHCMRAVNQAETENSSKEATSSNQSKSESESESATKTEKTRKYGFAMSLLGMLSNVVSASLVLALICILSGTLSGTSGQNVGLLVTTIVGFLTVIAAVGCYFGLPVLPSRKWPENAPIRTAFITIFLPFKGLFARRNMLFLLLSYTIFTDVSFALYSIVSQLYYTEIVPSTLEYSLFALAFNLFSCVSYVGFFFAQRMFKLRLEKCLVYGYALLMIVPIWGCVGISSQDKFGDKHRWEFYIQLLIFQISGAIVNPTFRLLFSELIPVGEELMWFGMQIVLSCATSWVNYVATAPLQNKTHNLRFPLILCLIFTLIPVIMEAFRITLPSFKNDLLRWQNEIKQESVSDTDAEYTLQSEKGAMRTVEEVA